MTNRFRRAYGASLLITALALAGGGNAHSADTLHIRDPDPILERWRRTVFPLSELQVSTVTAFYEDRHGNIWLGTDRGVHVYDGYFWQRNPIPEVSDRRIRTIFQAGDGAMWFGTYDGVVIRSLGDSTTVFGPESGLVLRTEIALGGIAELADGRMVVGLEADLDSGMGGIYILDGATWTRFQMPPGYETVPVAYLLVASNGSLWMTTWRSQGVFRFNGTKWTRYSTDSGLIDNDGHSVLESEDGAIWIAHNNGVCRFDGTGWRAFSGADGLSPVLGPFYDLLMQGRDGRIWATGYGLLSEYDGQRWKTYTTEELDDLPAEERFPALLTSRGALWFYASEQEVICRFDLLSERWRVYDLPIGSRPNGRLHTLSAVGQDVWLSAQGMLIQFTGDAWIRYSETDGLPDGSLHEVFQDGEGRTWVAGEHEGLAAAALKTESGWHLFAQDEEVGGKALTCGTEGENGKIWFGAREGAFSFDGSRWTRFGVEDGLPDQRISDIARAPDGSIWYGTYQGATVFDGDIWKTDVPGGGGYYFSKVRTICATRSGEIWAGGAAPDLGAWRWDGSSWEKSGRQHGLLSDRVWTIHEAANGELWFGTGLGMSSYDGETWGVYRKDQIPEDVGRGVTGIATSPDGAVWFQGETGRLVRLRPDKDPPSLRLVGGATQVGWNDRLFLTYEGRDRWDETPPDQLRYRWRLDDKEWSEWTYGRDLALSSTSPGKHYVHIQVMDRNRNVVQAPLHHAFTVIAPLWRQPAPVAVVLVLLTLAGYQSVRVFRRGRRLVTVNSQLQATNHRLQEEIDERIAAETAQRELDLRVQHLRFLFELRSALSGAENRGTMLGVTGEYLVGALGETAAKIVIHVDGLKSSHGTGETGTHQYRQTLSWSERERGSIEIRWVTDGNPARDIALFRESMSILVAELQTRELNERLIQSSRLVSLGEMAAAVAHEFNQPLSAISTTVGDVYLRIVEGLRLPPEQLKKMMVGALGMVRRLSDTVDHLRVFSRDSSEDPFAEVSLNEAVEGAHSIIRAQLSARGHTCRLDPQADLPAVMGNPHQLEQVFLNLLANARDAVEERHGSMGGEIEVQTRFEGDFVTAIVRDNGVGMTPEQTRRIFDPFYTTKEAARGTGLGLSITYSIIRTHNGLITCESEPGNGTQFLIRLPPVEGG